MKRLPAMIDFKKMDEKDFVFINKPTSEQEDKAFSAFLKARKSRKGRVKQVLKAKAS